jgi:D-amino-acid dehydrogenase
MWNPESPFYIKPRLSRDLLAWGIHFWRAANSGHVARSSPVLRDLHLASRACYEELAERQGCEVGLVKKGLLMLCRTRHGLDEEARTAALARGLGIPADVLDAGQAAALDPGVQMDIAGAVYYPRDCHFNPGRFMASLTEILKAAGAEFSWQTKVTGWCVAGKCIEAVRTSTGDYSADEYVLAGGSWSPVIARDLRLKLPMQAGRGYSLTLSHPPRIPALCSILTEARVAVTPMGATLRIGGTMEIAGLDQTINPARVQGITRAVPRYLPDFSAGDFQGVRAWCGLRPCSPDGLPYLGRPDQYSNLVIATGHGMMGMSLGPVTGKLAAQIISGERPAIEIGMLSPDRFA